MADNSILAELRYDDHEGSLRFRGVRYLLIRPETLAALTSALETEAGRAVSSASLYRGGFTGGQLSGQRYKQDFGLSDREAVKFMCRMGGEIGWGRFSLIELDEQAGRLVVEVSDSAFATASSDAEPAPTCHLTRGVLSGLLSGLTGREVISQETDCAGMGGPVCRFEIEVDD